MWGWIDRLKQFVVTATNRLLGKDAVTSVRDLNVSVNEGAVAGVTEAMLSDQITIYRWETDMRAILKDNYIQLYLLGRGGVPQLSFADYGSIGGMLGEQYRYLSDFAAEIAAGGLSPGEIRMRAAMYARSSRESFERAKGRAYGIPEGLLPAYPGDGESCLGLTNCRCSWQIDEVYDKNGDFTGWDCTWTLGASDPCILCQDHSNDWNPLFIPAPVAEEA